MKEIKFRGKRKFDGNVSKLDKWEYGYYRIFQKKHYINNYEVFSKTVGQYTGRKLDGEKLFEGDILETRSKYGAIEWDNDKLTYIVTIGDINYLLDFLLIMSEDFNLKLTGNIYDNPELLKGG